MEKEGACTADSKGTKEGTPFLSIFTGGGGGGGGVWDEGTGIEGKGRIEGGMECWGREVTK